MFVLIVYNLPELPSFAKDYLDQRSGDQSLPDSIIIRTTGRDVR